MSHKRFELNSQGQSSGDFDEQRRGMVRKILDYGIADRAVISAMARVPRHCFVDPEQRSLAYSNCPLPIGYGQTISQPYIVAYMAELADLMPHHRVLEIGTGCGYGTAILADLAGEVYSVEVIPELVARSHSLINELGYTNIHLKTGNGYQGWPEQAPYDRIVVTAAPSKIPPALIDQLAMSGKMVLPVGDWYQEIWVVTRDKTGLHKQRTIPVRFVPMVGAGSFEFNVS